MSDDQPEIVVVGNGLFGSAATRHLAERGHRVLNIGARPSGPDIRLSTEDGYPPHRVYSSHNDAARLTRLQDRDPSWAKVTTRAVAGYRDLEERSGIEFFHDVGCLIVSRPGGDGVSPDPLLIMNETGVDYAMHEPGDRSWRDNWPALDFPTSHYVAFEGPPAGYIRPKSLIDAQNVLAGQAGASFLADTVTGLSKLGGRINLMTAGGLEVETPTAVVCAGGFSNFNGLLPHPVEVTLKSEVIILGEVTEADAAALSDVPTVKYLIDVGDLESIYMVPPVRYENGRYYIKMGANTRLDEQIGEHRQLQQWFNTSTDEAYLPLYEPVLRALWPSIDFLSVRTQPCLITYSEDRFPIIKNMGDGLYVATAGNGGGAKGSDGWGELIADLVEQE